MTTDLASLYIKVDSDGVVTAGKNLDDLTDKSQKTEKATDSLSSSYEKLGKQLNQYAKYAAAAATALAVYQLQKQVRIAIGLASDLQEVQSKFDVVFSGQQAKAEKWAKTLVDAYAMSTIEAKKYLSSIQDLLVPMGMSSVNAGELSNEIVKLSADLASFNNLPTEQVMLNIQSALTGEFEAMKKYGIILNKTIIEQKALTMGLADTTDEITGSIRANAAYAVMVEASAAALGDMERTMDSAANQQKQQQALLSDISTLLGQAILPYYEELITLTNNWLLSNKSIIEQDLAGYIEDLGGAIIYALGVMRFFHNAWLGIKFVGTAAIQLIAVSLDELFKQLRVLLYPLELIYDGMVKIGAIKTNPFDKIAESLGIFRLSSGDVTSDVLNDIEETNRSYDEMIKTINELKEALAGATPGETQDSGTLPSLEDAGPSTFISIEDAEAAAEDLLKLKLDMYEGLSAYEDEYREAQIEWIYRVRDAQIEAGLDEVAARIKATKEIEKIDQEAFERKSSQFDSALGDMATTFKTVGSMYEEGSGSYDKMQKAAQAMMVVQQGVAVANAVAAISNQGLGDPYTAFGRIAAMTSAMVGLLSSVGLSLGGGGGSGGARASAPPQASTVLGGELGEGSESLNKTYELMEETYSMQLRELSGLNASMKDLNNNLTGVVPNIIREDLGSIFGYIAGQGGRAGDLMRSLAGAGLGLGSATVGGLQAGDGLDVEAFTSFGNIREARELNQNTVDALTSVYEDLSSSLIDLTAQLGTDMETTMEYMFQAIDIDLRDKSADEISEALQEYFSSISDVAAAELFGPLIEGYQQVGEGLYETAIRLVTDKAIITDMLEKTGQAFTGTVPEIIEFTETIILMAGGLETLQDSFESFYSEFIPESERFVNLQNDLTGALSDLNAVLPDTREGYKDLVQGLDLTTESGQEAYVALLSLSEQAADYYSQVEDLQDEQFSLQLELLEAQGEAEEALALARQAELDAMDPTLAAIQQQIWAQEELNEAMDTYTSITEALSAAIGDISGTGAISTQAGFNALFASAMGGDTEALAALPAAAKTFLAAAKETSQSELEYRRLQSQVLNQLGQAETFSSSQLALLDASIPGHATGLSQVPYDGYLMKAHKDEAVLTAPEAARWRNQSGGNVTSLSEFKELKDELIALRKVVESGNYQIAKNTGKTATVIGRFDDDGMPAERQL